MKKNRFNAIMAAKDAVREAAAQRGVPEREGRGLGRGIVYVGYTPVDVEGLGPEGVKLAVDWAVGVEQASTDLEAWIHRHPWASYTLLHNITGIPLATLHLYAQGGVTDIPEERRLAIEEITGPLDWGRRRAA
jgi:hypothetical protein